MSAQSYVLEQYANEAWTNSEKREWQAGPALNQVELHALGQAPTIGRPAHEELVKFSDQAEQIRRRWEQRADEEYDPSQDVNKRPVKVYAIASGVALAGCVVSILLQWAGWFSLILMLIGLLVVGGIAYAVWMNTARWQQKARTPGTLTADHQRGLEAELDQLQQEYQGRLRDIDADHYDIEESTDVLSDRNAAIGVITDKGLLTTEQAQLWTSQPLGGVRLLAERLRIQDTPSAQARLEGSPVPNRLTQS